MIQFFKDSIREIKHVVWPTSKQTLDYFFLVLFVLVFFTIYLWIFNVIFGEFVLKYFPMIVDQIKGIFS